MKPETERMLRLGISIFVREARTDVQVFLGEIKNLEDDWSNYINRMIPHLPKDLVDRVFQLTRAEGLFEKCLLTEEAGVIKVEKLQLFDVLEADAQEREWTHVQLLAACRMTEEELLNRRKRLQQLREEPSD